MLIITKDKYYYCGFIRSLTGDRFQPNEHYESFYELSPTTCWVCDSGMAVQTTQQS